MQRVGLHQHTLRFDCLQRLTQGLDLTAARELLAVVLLNEFLGGHGAAPSHCCRALIASGRRR